MQPEMLVRQELYFTNLEGSPYLLKHETWSKCYPGCIIASEKKRSERGGAAFESSYILGLSLSEVSLAKLAGYSLKSYIALTQLVSLSFGLFFLSGFFFFSSP